MSPLIPSFLYLITKLSAVGSYNANFLDFTSYIFQVEPILLNRIQR